jgi:rubrerythrin
MVKIKQESVVDFLHCASVLEERTFLLYKNLADKVDIPLVNSLLLHIAYDSQKHSAILKGIGGSIAEAKKPSKNCEKKLFGPVWASIERLAKEIAREDKIPKKNMASLVKKLMILESTVGEEYYILVQLKTLEYMTREIRETYNVDLEDLKDILGTIIRDEETHRILLSKMKKILVGKDEQARDKAPQVKYKSPDSWTAHIPAGIT